MSTHKQHRLAHFAISIIMALWIYPYTVVAQSSPATHPGTTAATPLLDQTQPDAQVDTMPSAVPDIPDDGVKRYLVELIILQNNTETETNTEIWDRLNVIAPDPRYGSGANVFEPTTTHPPVGYTEIPYPATGPGQPLGAGVNHPAELAASEHDLPPQVIPTGLDHLADRLRILQLNDKYRVIKHAAWIQPLSGKKRAPTVDLSQLPVYLSAQLPTTPAYPLQPPSQVSGTLRIYENQLVFIEAELTFRRPEQAAPMAPQTDTNLAPHGPMTFKLSEKRRVKLNELHYLDHPYYGVLIRVSRWGEPLDNKNVR